MISNRPIITLAAFISLAINGLTFSFIGASLPEIQDYIGITIDQAGLMMACLQSGFTLFCFVGGILSDLKRGEQIMFSGCFLLGIGLSLFCNVPGFAINMILIFITGAGMGCILSGSNTLLAKLYPTTKGTILNLHHVFFGLGSLVGPVIMSFMIEHNKEWRSAYFTEAIILAGLCVVFLLSRTAMPHFASGVLFKGQIKRLFTNNHFLIILFVITLAVGAQLAILLLGVTFLVQAKDCSLTLAGAALSSFAIFLMTGRVICSKLTQSTPLATIVLALLWLQVITLILAWYGERWMAVAALSLSGLTFSGIYPICLALVSTFFPKVEGVALGSLSTVGGLGSIMFCWVSVRSQAWLI